MTEKILQSQLQNFILFSSQAQDANNDLDTNYSNTF